MVQMHKLGISLILSLVVVAPSQAQQAGQWVYDPTTNSYFQPNYSIQFNPNTQQVTTKKLKKPGKFKVKFLRAVHTAAQDLKGGGGGYIAPLQPVQVNATPMTATYAGPVTRNPLTQGSGWILNP